MDKPKIAKDVGLKLGVFSENLENLKKNSLGAEANSDGSSSAKPININNPSLGSIGGPTFRANEVSILIELVNLLVFLAILLVFVFSQLFQRLFFDSLLVGPVYFAFTCFFFIHSLYAWFFEKLLSFKWPKLFLPLLNSLFIAVLSHYSDFGSSFFLFVFLVNILGASLLAGGRGAFATSLLTSVLFNLVFLVQHDFKTTASFFSILLSNIGFFSVAGLSAFVAEELKLFKQELKKKEKSLEEITNFSELVLSVMPLALLVMDANKKTILKNEKFLQLIEKLRIGEDEFLLWVEQGSLQDTGSSYRVFDHLEKKWQFRIYQEQLILNSSLHRIFIVEDITEQKALEDQLRQQEKLAGIGLLAAGIAHEIRNPLAGISGSVQMLFQTVENEEDKKLFQIIIKETNRLNNLISEFLDYAKPDDLKNLKMFSLTKLVEDILELIKNGKAQELNVHIELQAQEDCQIQGDENKIKQAILNIIMNAVESMDRQERRELKVVLKKMESATGPLTGGVKLLVKDSGSGIKPEVLPRIFEPFLTTKNKGTGLGLAVSHKILTSHKCQIEVESLVGEGTEFKLSFPKSLQV